MFLLLLLLSSTYGYERLRKDVYPTKYHLILRPSFEGDYTFHGDLSINLFVNDTDTIILDCEDLNVTSTSLYFDEFFAMPHNYEQIKNRLIVRSRTPLKSTYQVQLNVTFQGRIRKDMAGFYLSTYQFEGKQRVLGTTQFQSNNARKAFPCFDEPLFRANFSLEVIVHPNMSAISNQPVISNHVANGTRRIVFAERPSIPTYLVAWIIYEPESYGYVSKNVTTNCNQNRFLTYSIWSDLTYKNETSLALNAAPEIVSALENFTDVSCEAVKYKMDLAAIPDFQAGAMENWEIITFRESALLYNNLTSSVSDKQSILMIVAHELVHQWFGDLVTLDWWSYTWLNEGFARYLQYVIIDMMYPEMNMMAQFLVDRRQIALEADSPRAHPLTNNNITSQIDVDYMFDEITYDKGASVIHMWRSTISDEQFRRGIKNYLNNVVRLGGVSRPEYLFSALFSGTSWNNNQLGSMWTLQSGYPVVVATEKNSTLSLRQIKVTGWNTTEEGHWLIPITIIINNNRTFSYNLEPNNSLHIQLGPNDTSYIINPNQSGFYRVMYHNISRWLPTATTDLTRSMLINDAMALSKAGLLPYETSMTIVSHHLKSNEYFPWISALRAFSMVDDILLNSELEPRWKELILNLMDNVMRKVGLNESLSDNHILKLHKINLLKYGCKFEHIDCLIEAAKLASNLSYGTPDVRDALLCTAARMGDEIWNQIFMRYNSSNSPTEKQSYLKALPCTINRPTIRKFLEMLLTPVIRKQDIASTVIQICNSPEGAEEVLNFIKNNYPKLQDLFVNQPKRINDILSAATKFVDNSQLAEIQSMASVLPQLITKSFISNLEQAITQKKNHVTALRDFLLKADNPETTPTEETGTEGTSDNHSSKQNIEITLILLVLPIFYIQNRIM